MSKLHEDPKVQALVAKERAAAHKELHKHLKAVAKELPVPEDKHEARGHKAAVKSILDGAKAFFNEGAGE